MSLSMRVVTTWYARSLKDADGETRHSSKHNVMVPLWSFNVLVKSQCLWEYLLFIVRLKEINSRLTK
jgi:hypothetical protein